MNLSHYPMLKIGQKVRVKKGYYSERLCKNPTPSGHIVDFVFTESNCNLPVKYVVKHDCTLGSPNLLNLIYFSTDLEHED